MEFSGTTWLFRLKPENARKIYQRPHHMRDNNPRSRPGCECKGDSQHGQIAAAKGRERLKPTFDL